MNYWDDIHPAFESAEAMLAAVNDDMTQLPEAVQAFLSVYGAQGVIDNGGLEYFFEADWDGTPPYDDVIAAFETIGCSEQAAALRDVVGTFPFVEPHLHRDKRQAFMDAHYDAEVFGVPEWRSAYLMFNDKVWEKLAEYCEAHRDEFA
ncbi:MAG TPA: DUF4375 domain-containing protein [Verrucomicrobiae bacterium]